MVAAELGGYTLVIINTSIRPLCFRRHQARTRTIIIRVFIISTNMLSLLRGFHTFIHFQIWLTVRDLTVYLHVAWLEAIHTQSMRYFCCDGDGSLTVSAVISTTTAIASINRILQPTPQSTLTSLLTEWTSESNVDLQDARFKTTVCFNLLNILNFVKLIIWIVRWNLHIEL